VNAVKKLHITECSFNRTTHDAPSVFTSSEHSLNFKQYNTKCSFSTKQYDTVDTVKTGYPAYKL
jgi:hypothetical protein